MRPGVREVGGAVSVSGRPVASVPRRGVTWYVRRYWLLYLLTVPSYLLVIVFVYLPVSTAGTTPFFNGTGSHPTGSDSTTTLLSPPTRRCTTACGTWSG